MKRLLNQVHDLFSCNYVADRRHSERPLSRIVRIETLEQRCLLAAATSAVVVEAAPPQPTQGNGMTLVGQWNDHDHLYADVWAEEITRGRHKGTYAYLGHFGSQGGVDIIDITDPVNPTLASTFLGTGGDNEIHDVKVQDGIGFFASDNPDSGGVYVVDVSNPFAPVQLARIDASNGGFDDVHNVFVEDGYLYEIDNGTTEVRVFDVTDPADPSFLRVIPGTSPGASHAIHDVTVKDGRLYTASPFVGRVGIYDIRNVGDLSNPVPLIGSFNDPAGATHSL
jgi:hypothetical protein